MPDKPATQKQLFQVHLGVFLVMLVLVMTYVVVLRPIRQAVQRIEQRCSEQ